MNRNWRRGAPPFAGWWNASQIRDTTVWRWWNGHCWSIPVSSFATPRDAGKAALKQHGSATYVEWNDQWPAGARVARVYPDAVSA